jgi:hypothetical protein
MCFDTNQLRVTLCLQVCTSSFTSRRHSRIQSPTLSIELPPRVGRALDAPYFSPETWARVRQPTLSLSLALRVHIAAAAAYMCDPITAASVLREDFICPTPTEITSTLHFSRARDAVLLPGASRSLVYVP